MISKKCIAAYWQQYPDGAIGYKEPGTKLSVEENETLKAYVAPENETDDVFMDRLRRSKESGRNLFFEEWEEDNEYRKGVIY